MNEECHSLYEATFVLEEQSVLFINVDRLVGWLEDILSMWHHRGDRAQQQKSVRIGS